MSQTFQGHEIESPFQTAVGKHFDTTKTHDGLSVEEMSKISRTVHFRPVKGSKPSNNEDFRGHMPVPV